MPVLTGCGLHLLLCARSYEPGLTGLRELWLSGRSLQSGGALSGGLAVGFSAVFGKVLSLILFLLMLLAALCLARGARALDQNGRIYDESNMDALLAMRHVSAKIRRGGGRLRGPRKRTPEQDRAFAQSLRDLLRKGDDT